MTTNIIKQMQDTGLSLNPEDRKYFENQMTVPFFPNITLIQGVSPQVALGGVLGHFFLTIKNKPLSEKIIICICGSRPHALLIIDNRKIKESFIRDSIVFKSIQATVASGQSVRVSHGIDFLCWLPEEDEFGVFFPGRPMFRPTGQEILSYLPAVDNTSRPATEFTNCFELWAKMEKAGLNRQALVPKVTPIKPEHSLFPTDEQFQEARTTFYKAVEAELSIVENKSTADR